MADTHDSIDRQYQSLRPALDRLETECRYIIEDALRQAGIKTHSVLSRVKTLDSIREKIARKEKTQSLDEIDDLLGIRIVCLLRSDIARIGDLIRAEFEVMSEDNKLDGANIEAFGYQSVHFIARLNASCKGRRYTGLHGQIFEIQVRTVAMDAWATLSHYLDYKNEIDVPRDLRKDFFALSGLFYVADTHFELFYGARQKSSTEAFGESHNSQRADQELNLDTLMAFLNERYPERSHIPASSISELLAELVDCGYTDIEKIRDSLAEAEPYFLTYERRHPPFEEANEKYADMGVVRIALSIIDQGMFDRVGYPKDDNIVSLRKEFGISPKKGNRRRRKPA